MFKNKLILLTLITVVVVVAASIFVKLRAPQSEKDKPLFFPELAGQIESVNHISIENYAGSVNLTQIDDFWTIDEFDGYPALPDKVKSAVLGAADLRINSPKTSLPRLYHRLGVEGPGKHEESTSVLLTIKDASSKDIIEVILGKSRLSSASQSSPGLYVRKPDDERSYLVDGVMDITAVKTNWIERSLFDIPKEAIKSVRIVHTDGDTFTLLKNEKGQEHFQLQNLPFGKKIAPEIIINKFGTILQDVQINGARSKEKLQAPEKTIAAKIITFEAIIVDIVAFELEGISYASFEFKFDDAFIPGDEEQFKPDDVKASIENLNARTSNWWFEIQEFKYDELKKRSDDVIRDDSTNFVEKDAE